MNRAKRPPLPLLLAAGATALLAAAARAGDDGVTRSHQDGYPRCSDVPPVPPEASPDGYGDDNDADGTQYDTNLLFDASRGDENAVWMIVRDACIDGGGLVVNDDPSEATRGRQDAWGEDRLSFCVADSSASGGSIVVRNRMSVTAAWVLAGNGRNSATMLASMVDIWDKVHQYQNVRSVSPVTTITEGSSESDSASQGWGTEVGASPDVVGASGESETKQSKSSGETRTITSTTTSDDADHDLWELETMKSFSGTSCSVRIASTSTISLKAQALAEDIETSTEVTEFDVVNIVDAAYVVPIPPPPPPPSGDPGSGGPSTPGSGDGSTPKTPGDGDGGSGPQTPDGGTPPVPPEPKDPNQPPVPPGPMPGSDPAPQPGTGSTSGGPISGGDGGGGTGGTTSGTEPAGTGGTVAGGSTGTGDDGSSTGGTAPPDPDGSGTQSPDGSLPGLDLGGTLPGGMLLY
jgi:hypothetical protein